MTIEEMYEARNLAREEFDACERHLAAIEAQIATAEGDPLKAEWQRCRARGDREAEHAAYLHMMAVRGIQSGIDPARWVIDDAEKRRAELRAEVAKLRGAGLGPSAPTASEG